jgi:hypothetical protein
MFGETIGGSIFLPVNECLLLLLLLLLPTPLL